jgi:hypothetical protein
MDRPDRANLELEFRISSKVLKELSPDEKVRIYELLRMICCYRDFPEWNYIFSDYCELLRRRGFKHERYFYLTSLTDSQFCYEIDCTLWNKTYRRNFYRTHFSKFGKNQLTLKELLFKFFVVKLYIQEKKKPKRLIRHKGYRDHGSLGTGVPGLAADIERDVWVQERELLKEKKRKDFLKFLSGFAGWE